MIEARVSAVGGNSIRAAVIERNGEAGGHRDVRIATFHGSLPRWHRFRAILSAGAEAAGVPFVVVGRETRAAA